WLVASLLWWFAASFSFSLIDFFFRAEDGIRDRNVTGVQTCALPILSRVTGIFTGTTISPGGLLRQCPNHYAFHAGQNLPDKEFRSEERRVGKECRSERWL